ncbi:testis-expressed protein 11-like [Sycon ciliatum]|uniref:testis-expressed protein 11-like n=1 Tax=Sycon ciliatum TaxID=27933 RepID=UPI0020AC1C23|eukprot:scpid19540/ scgid25344/ Testis-expressed sequence 11 protein
MLSPEKVSEAQQTLGTAEFSRRAQELVEKISGCSGDQGSTENVLDDLVQLIDGFPVEHGSSSDPNVHKPFQDSYNSAINLWNLAVTFKSNGTLAEEKNSLNAQMRHAACRLASLCTMSLPSTSAAFAKVAQMALKTARAWIECENPSMAEASLALASEFHIKQTESYQTEHDTAGACVPEAKRKEQDAQRLRIDLYEVEVASSLGQQQRAVDKFMDVKSLLGHCPKQGPAAAMLAYNLGVTCFKQFNFPFSATWLRESHDVGKLCRISPSKQARTLRLLSRAYVESSDDSNLQKALNAADLANTEQLHPAGLYCKLSVLLKMSASESLLRQALLEYVSHPEVSIDMALVATKDLVQHNRSQLAATGLEHLATRHQNTPNEMLIHLEELELLLQLEKTDDACRVVDHCLSSHNEYQPLSAADRQRLHTVLWKHAASAYEAGKYKLALMWYDYSAEFFSSSELESKNSCKLQRNRCLCFLGLRHFNEAALAIQQAQQYDPDNPYSHFLLFKIALLQGEDQKAIDELKAMVQVGSKASREVVSKQEINGLISLAAQLAFEKSNRGIAMHALEGLIQYSADGSQVLVALRCLVRLRCTFLSESNMSDLASLVFYIKTALEKLQAMCSDQSSEEIQSEVTWFMKMAWNITLQCVDAVEELHSFFILCYKFTLLLPSDNTLLVRQKTCLLMAAAASLQLARESSDKETKEGHLVTTLEHIKECQRACDLLTKRQIARSQQADMARVLITLYEFECKAKLRQGDLQSILDSLSDMDSPDGNTFETVAAIAVDAPGDNRQVAMNALRLAVKRHMDKKPPDIIKYSKAIHSLIHLALQVHSDVDRAEALHLYSSVMDILSRPEKTAYPEMEIVWLMTKSWNTGILLFSAMSYLEAEKWCSQGLNLLEKLPTMKANYESQMTTAYADVLSKAEVYQSSSSIREE